MTLNGFRCYNVRMIDNVEHNIAKNLTELRKSQNLKQTELSEATGYSDKTISRWENGSSVPDIATLVKLADFYGITIEDLISENALNKQKNIDATKDKISLVNSISFIILSFLTAWLSASVIYIGALVIFKYNFWQIFVWAIPVSAYAVYYKTSKLYKIKWLIFVLLSIIYVGLITALFIQLYSFSFIFWQLFLLVPPIEGMLIITCFFRQKESK